jgi:murein DD-endopeptidase MepM/ murein hydrolase activator NlpD
MLAVLAALARDALGLRPVGLAAALLLWAAPAPGEEPAAPAAAATVAPDVAARAPQAAPFAPASPAASEPLLPLDDSPAPFPAAAPLDEEEVDAPEASAEARSAAAAGDASRDGGEPALPDLAVLTAEPVRGVANSGFGWRDDPIRHRRRFHRGTDFRSPRGTPVYAAAGGVVVSAGRHHGYGKCVDVRHGDGLLTRYAHLSAIEVAKGQTVATDERIGRVGATGRATGPHLHFEVHVQGRAVDPNLAVRLGELQRGGDPELLRLAALSLRREVQDATVSAIDPPRPARVRERPRRRRHDS